MIHLALWLVSLCVVVFFGLAILAGIVHVIGSMMEGISKAMRSDKPKASAKSPVTFPIGKISDDVPKWVVAAGWITFIAMVVGAATFADGADQAYRARLGQMQGWMYIALGVIGGAFLGPVVSMLLMRARRNEARRRAAREVARQKEELCARSEAREAALRAYPDYLDNDTLCDPEGEYAWPDELFSRLFVVPDIIVPYAPQLYDGEIRLWSKTYVAERSRDPEYIEYREELERERRAREEELRLEEAERQREEAERQREEEEARAVEEAKRVEAEALAARRARQIVIPVEELKRDRK